MTGARRTAGAALAATALVAAAAPAAQAAPTSARDGAQTSLAPTGLVFTADGSALTIGYDAETSPAVVAKLKARGLIGTVSCTVRTEQGNGVAGAAVTWLKSASSVTVDLGTPADAPVVSCRLSQVGDSADPIQVFLDAAAAKRQAARIEVTRMSETAARAAAIAKRIFKGGFVAGRRDERDIARSLAKADKAHTYRVAKRQGAVVRSGVVYVLKSSNRKALQLAQRLSNGRLLVTTVTRKAVTTKVVRAARTAR